MKALTIISSALFGASLVFLTFSFSQASFDIAAWTETTRGLCAVYMLMAGCMCGRATMVCAK